MAMLSIFNASGSAASAQSQRLNVVSSNLANADTVAGALAAALEATKLIMMTGVEGIYQDFADKASLIREMTIQDARQILTDGTVDKGMIPKVDACITAVANGVKRAHILDGRLPHALLIEVFTDQGLGTMIR